MQRLAHEGRLARFDRDARIRLFLASGKIRGAHFMQASQGCRLTGDEARLAW
jgi:hypothetical protein